MRRSLRDPRGTSAVEFGLAMPLLLLLFAGGFQLNDAIAVYRKLTVATRTIADLSSQYAILNDAKTTTILNASRQVMTPYSTTNATMVISQIKIDGNGKATVDWSRAQNISPLTEGSDYTLSPGVRQPNTYLLVARMTYTYKPLFASTLIGTIPMSETIIMSPRVSDRVGRE